MRSPAAGRTGALPWAGRPWRRRSRASTQFDRALVADARQRFVGEEGAVGPTGVSLPSRAAARRVAELELEGHARAGRQRRGQPVAEEAALAVARDQSRRLREARDQVGARRLVQDQVRQRRAAAVFQLVGPLMARVRLRGWMSTCRSTAASAAGAARRSGGSAPRIRRGRASASAVR
jgi:hypothetical protein